MTSLSAMDWNAKTPLQWDWENIITFNAAKAAEIPKPTDWGIDVDTGGSLYSPGGGGSGSGGAVSDVVHVSSSSKSSKSASVDSSSIERATEFRFEEFEGFHGRLSSSSSKKQVVGKTNQTQSSPLVLEASVGSGEPLIGLKLGKRTYFEDLCTGNTGKSSSSSIYVNPMSSAPTAKRSRSSCQSNSPRCQVEGCDLDLSSAKEYHRKHKICESHSKCPKVVVNGLERRFCQQCSRFHGLAEFDEKKRSCRKRLSDHNARRRKPQHETIQFNSPRPGSLLYDGRQQMELNRFPYVHSSPIANLTLESTCNSKFTLTKECPLRPAKTTGIDGQLHLPSSEPPNAIGMLYRDSKWLLSSKGGTAEVLNEGLEESMISTNSDAAQDLRRALSLLSTNSWGSCEPASVDHRMAVTNTRMPHSRIDSVSLGLPSATSENWRTEQSSDLQMHALTGQNNGSGHFPEFQLFKVPYGSGF